MLAFSRSVLHLGILGRERLRNWKLVGWTVFRRRRSFSMATTGSINGHHLRKVIELQIAGGRNPG